MADFSFDVNGHTYTDEMFEPYNYVVSFPALAQDLVIVSAQASSLYGQAVTMSGAATGALASAQAAQASAATSAAQAAASAGVAGSGAATTLLYPQLSKLLATATDVSAVFVYDTRQDSDGGLWRFACAHTSWYQEDLNTTTRGARREFPAVAALVVRGTTAASALTIYDLTDLDGTGAPRMWMVIRGGAGGSPLYGGSGSIPLTSVFALNGRLYLTASGSGGLTSLNFPADMTAVRIADSSRYYSRPIADRAASVTRVDASFYSATLAGRDLRCVHARALPGAPLDSRGMPIPTVIVGEATSFSVIHPNGNVASVTGSSDGFGQVYITRSGQLMVSGISNGFSAVGPMIYATTTSSTWVAASRRHSGAGSSYPLLGSVDARRGVGETSDALAFAGTVAANTPAAQAALSLMAYDYGSPSNGMVCAISASHTTGWQVGDIRGAWLTEIAAGAIPAASVADEPFDVTTGWSSTTGTISAASGVATLAAAGTGTPGMTKSFNVTSGTTYAVRIRAERLSGRAAVAIQITGPGVSGVVAQQFGTVVGWNEAHFQFNAVASSNINVNIYEANASATAADALRVDFLTIDAAVADRSYKGKPLKIVGPSLTRAAAAAGAELVGYSGYSLNSYLEQPYNADLDFGTGDFCVSLLIKATGSVVIWSRGSTASGPSYEAIINTNGGITFRASTTGSSPYANIVGVTDIRDGQWHTLDLVRRGASAGEIWIDGVRDASGTINVDLTNTAAILRLGLSAPLSNAPLSLGSLALVRVSASAPSRDQIERMSRDQLALIRANAKCTLGGVSNASTALAADPERNTVLLGTTDGASEFSGLVRTAYYDTASVAPLTDDAMTAVASRAGYRLMAGAAQAIAYRPAVNGADEMIEHERRVKARPDGYAVTTDATATDMAPRFLWVGEGETVNADWLVTGTIYGATATESGQYRVSAAAKRETGGTVALLGTPTVTVVNETTSSMTVAPVADTATNTLRLQVTGKASTRIEWRATLISLVRSGGSTLYDL